MTVPDIGILASKLAILSNVGDNWMRCTYLLHTNHWSRSRSEEGMLRKGAPSSFIIETLDNMLPKKSGTEPKSAKSKKTTLFELGTPWLTYLNLALFGSLTRGNR